MVGNTGRTAPTRRVRRLKSPQAVEVEAGPAGKPARIRLAGGWTDLCLARRPWRIDQNWWRGESSRTYYRVALTDGPLLTLYQDLTSGGWFKQEY